MRRSLQAVCAAALVTLMVPAVGAADPIQTAIQQPTRGGGASLFAHEFVGVKFNEPATTTAIGGVFGQVLDIAGAVVQLSSASDCAGSHHLTTHLVLIGDRVCHVHLGPRADDPDGVGLRSNARRGSNHE